MIVYLHGFNGSPTSFKPRLLSDRMRALGVGEEFRAPGLPDLPNDAIKAAEAEIADSDPAAVTWVGSSLGGYYATWLAEKHGCRAVLVNPALRAYELLVGNLGEHTNPYTGERYRFTREHLVQLRQLEVASLALPQRYLLLVTTGDKVLDYRRASAYYLGARQIVVEGGDHSFSGFGDHLDAVLRFARVIA